MEYPWNVVAITCFVVVGVVAILLVLFHFRLLSGHGLFSRKKKSVPKERIPKSVQHAIIQLEGVTKRREKKDLQAELADAECPICLGCLFASEQQQQHQQQASKPEDEEVDLEAGRGTSGATTAATPAPPSGDEKRQSVQPIKDDVLEMKRCTHMFHSRCLATWFLNDKYDCPVCRRPYYQPPVEREEEAAEDEEYRYRREQDEYMYRHQLSYSIMPFF